MLRIAANHRLPDDVNAADKQACYRATLAHIRSLIEGETDEIVAPVLDPAGRVRAVLEVDSETLAAFDDVDARHLEAVCRWVPPGGSGGGE